jgi:hypothetical protein
VCAHLKLLVLVHIDLQLQQQECTTLS